MICDICGKKGARLTKITETSGKGENLLIIENVPLVVCPNCGESYFTAETLHELDRISTHKKSLAVERSVKVAMYVR